MKKLLFVLLIQSFVNANVIDGNTNAIASPRDLSLNTIEAGGLYTDAQTTSVKNYVLTNLSGQDRLWTFTTTSLLVLENTILDLDGTYTFTHGSIRVIGNCAINGSSDFSKFRFESHLIHIENNSELRIGPGVNFEYAPTGSTRSGIRFGNSSSKLTLEDATLTVSNRNGLNLIGGKLRIEGNSTVDNFFTEDNVQYLDHVASFTDKALFLGNGPTNYGDCKLHITSGAKLTVKNAGIVYRNIGAGAFDGSDGNGILVIDKKGSFLIDGDADFNTGGVALNFSKFKSMNIEGGVTSLNSFLQEDFANPFALACDWSSDGKYFVVGGGTSGLSQVKLYTFNGSTLTLLMSRDYDTSGDYPWTLKWSPDGKYLAVGGITGSIDQIEIFSFDSGSLGSLGTWTFYQTGDQAVSVDWSPDGKYLAVVGATGALSQIELFRFDGISLTSLGRWDYNTSGQTAWECDWSPDGKYLAVGGSTGTNEQIEVFGFNGASFTSLDVENYYGTGDVNTCKWSPDGKYIAVAGITDSTQKVQILSFNGATLTSLGFWDYNSSNDRIWECDWSPDGKYLVVVGVTGALSQIETFRFDGTSLTSLGTESYYQTGDDARSCKWSPDGRYVGIAGLTNDINHIELYKVTNSSDDQKLSTFKNANIKLDQDLILRDINLKLK